jgi:hypothetical protein
MILPTARYRRKVANEIARALCFGVKTTIFTLKHFVLIKSAVSVTRHKKLMIALAAVSQ